MTRRDFLRRDSHLCLSNVTLVVEVYLQRYFAIFDMRFEDWQKCWRLALRTAKVIFILQQKKSAGSRRRTVKVRRNFVTLMSTPLPLYSASPQECGVCQWKESRYRSSGLCFTLIDMDYCATGPCQSSCHWRYLIIVVIWILWISLPVGFNSFASRICI